MPCANQVSRLQTSSLSRFSMRANGRIKSFNYFKTNIKARRARNRDLQIQARQLKVQRKRRNASFVVRHSKPTDCPAYVQQCRICKKMNHFSKVCLSSKDSREKVYFAEEAEVDDYDSKESFTDDRGNFCSWRTWKANGIQYYTVAHNCHGKTFFCACNPHWLSLKQGTGIGEWEKGTL